MRQSWQTLKPGNKTGYVTKTFMLSTNAYTNTTLSHTHTHTHGPCLIVVSRFAMRCLLHLRALVSANTLQAKFIKQMLNILCASANGC